MYDLTYRSQLPMRNGGFGLSNVSANDEKSISFYSCRLLLTSSAKSSILFSKLLFKKSLQVITLCEVFILLGEPDFKSTSAVVLHFRYTAVFQFPILLGLPSELLISLHNLKKLVLVKESSFTLITKYLAKSSSQSLKKDAFIRFSSYSCYLSWLFTSVGTGQTIIGKFAGNEEYRMRIGWGCCVEVDTFEEFLCFPRDVTLSTAWILWESYITRGVAWCRQDPFMMVRTPAPTSSAERQLIPRFEVLCTKNRVYVCEKFSHLLRHYILGASLLCLRTCKGCYVLFIYFLIVLKSVGAISSKIQFN